ncbi:hypothetical protein PSN45_002996 [Yamadazyma tenuis]|uniref:Ribosomal RNA-processing protein 7 n=1 Tax=Candida tenuis (strain ATCC 10573 / BCRC 21748 / CBS 615 / JCM 9827 / NBRC 10315 / NRRL Y-1498 / VKM Y-70) TaxID=590646 RepID=G3AXK9_CANTC|nr:uncharacterized protein CANTEDRAFT_100606 [Yamadazyma tenuis ATCC 10573]EGV66411.1 hypothetical protein CANTEDRAFT_100606 [Yamadazyma tenuis ATCC 10573]WEJ95476.1 hypothetical protein PSN45_002996 [Yamadazyma tenuis]
MVTEIKGFKVLPLKIPNSSVESYIFFKKHEVKLAGDSESRSIFFCNLPIASTTKVLKKFFQNIAIGATMESFTASYLTDSAEDVFLDLSKLTSDLDIPSEVDESSAKLPKNCGIVTFIDKSAFQLAMNKLKSLSSGYKVVEWPLEANSFGSQYFLGKYHSQVLDVETLSNSVSQALIDFDKAEKDSIEHLSNQRELVDEDGFTLVVGPQRKTKAGILGQQKSAIAKAESQKAQAKMKKKQKEDFYRFQLREKKKEEMNELLRKFKADQEKVRAMSDKKRFRPY